MMDDTTMNNLKTVKEMVLDERKLVTYISISKELCIHVNDGKFLLSRIMKDIRENHPNASIFVSFIISGLLNNNSASTIVCSEKDIESIRKIFKNVFYEHIYSISHGLKSVDNVAFAAVNKFEDLPLCIGLIKGSFCLKRSQDEIGNLKSSSQTTFIESNTSKNNKEKVVKNEIVNKVHETKSESNTKSEIPSPKKHTSNNHGVKKNGKAITNSIAGFFNKGNSAPSLKSIKKPEPDITTNSKEDTNVKEEIIDSNKIIVKTEKETTTSNNLKTKKNSLTQIRKNAKVDKKRKRVLHVSDSDSDNEVNDPFADEMAVDQESEDEIPPTPTVSTVKITSGIVNPKKRRKVVDKTYTDEEGYILTKKEEVYESCSDEEVSSKENGLVKENLENLKANNKNVIEIKHEVSLKGKGKNGKKVSPPTKGKQASIMNFFSKKP